MSRISARLPLAICFLIGALSPIGFARAEEKSVWAEKASEGFISLTYGPLDANKQPVFLLSCFNEMEIAVLDIFGVVEGARPGEKLTIELSAASSHAIEGESGIDSKTGSMFAEASDIEVKPVLAVLKSPGPLTVKMAATSLTLSDAGRADAAERFSKNCSLE
jgi:hypothetical protein